MLRNISTTILVAALIGASSAATATEFLDSVKGHCLLCNLLGGSSVAAKDAPESQPPHDAAPRQPDLDHVSDADDQPKAGQTNLAGD